METPEQMNPTESRPEKEHVTLHVPMQEHAVYANASAFSLSEFDFRIQFSEAYPNRSVVSKASIVMPVEHAAYVLMKMLNLLFAFESQTGKIRQPDWRKLYDGLAGSGQLQFHPAEGPEAPTEK